MSRKALILGGCGFIGSHLVRRFLEAGDEVVVVDGIMPQSGGNPAHLGEDLPNVKFIGEAVDQSPSLPEYVRNSDVIVDCMAWTRHKLALEDPMYDMRLNAESHLYITQCLRQHNNSVDVIYLGSRSQYGRPQQSVIDESTHMQPVDVQGIHKLAAESYYRIFSGLHGFNAVSLRICNTFGPNQPVSGDDIGLIGSVIRGCVLNEVVEIFGSGRVKQFIYVADLADIVYRMSTCVSRGFSAYNVAGPALELVAVAERVISLSGKGRLKLAEMPPHIARIDTGEGVLSTERLEGYLGCLQFRNMDDALAQTISYFEQLVHERTDP